MGRNPSIHTQEHYRMTARIPERCVRCNKFIPRRITDADAEITKICRSCGESVCDKCVDIHENACGGK